VVLNAARNEVAASAPGAVPIDEAASTALQPQVVVQHNGPDDM
jgi:hypothetical protein